MTLGGCLQKVGVMVAALRVHVACWLVVYVLLPTSHVCLQIGLYSISFGFAWGPIGWLVPSEIHDLNTRSAGQSITVFTQLVSGAIVTQSTFLTHFLSVDTYCSEYTLPPAHVHEHMQLHH